MPTLRERIENDLPVFFLATLVTGFVGGFAAYRGIQEASNVVQIRRSDFEQLTREAETGRRRLSSPSSSPQSSGTTTDAASTHTTSDNARALDGTVSLLTSSNCWDYVAKPVSIGGRLFEAYAVIDHRCDESEALTFDVRGWRRFEGFVGVTESDSRANNLTIKADEEELQAVQVFYNQPAKAITIDLTGRSTLTFQKSGRYPLVVVGAPRLLRN